MQTGVEIDFHNMDRSPAVEARVRERIDRLDIAAVVSRGGRPDLAGGALERVRAPVLLIVGGADHAVLDLNRTALARIPGPKRLAIVPGASHLVEETGALEAVIDHAGDWFEAHLRKPAR